MLKDCAVNNETVIRLLERERCKGSKGDESTWSELAARIGCTGAYLSDVIHNKRYPGPTILKFLGLRKEIQFRKGE